DVAQLAALDEVELVAPSRLAARAARDLDLAERGDGVERSGKRLRHVDDVRHQVAEHAQPRDLAREAPAQRALRRRRVVDEEDAAVRADLAELARRDQL